MSLRLPYMDPVFVQELDLIVERIILNPCITRAQEKQLRILLDNVQASSYAAHEVARMLYDFEREVK